MAKQQKTIDQDIADSRRALKRLKEAGYSNGGGAYSLRKHIDNLKNIKRKMNGNGK